MDTLCDRCSGTPDKQYVDSNTVPIETPSADFEKPQNQRLRELLGRRLVREERFSEAKQYLNPSNNKLLDLYLTNLKLGKNTDLPKMERAKAFFTSAYLLRYYGLRFMGTEVAPDGADFDGELRNYDVAKDRLSGMRVERDYSNGINTQSNVPLLIKPTQEEIRRLKAHTIIPDIRYHYEPLATTIAIRAARLMPDNSEELADVLNCAGSWVKETDNKRADRIYNLVEGRCGKTELGKKILKRHWFVGESGPWSTEAAAQYPYDKFR